MNSLIFVRNPSVIHIVELYLSVDRMLIPTSAITNLGDGTYIISSHSKIYRDNTVQEMKDVVFQIGHFNFNKFSSSEKKYYPTKLLTDNVSLKLTKAKNCYKTIRSSIVYNRTYENYFFIREKLVKYHETFFQTPESFSEFLKDYFKEKISEDPRENFLFNIFEKSGYIL